MLTGEYAWRRNLGILPGGAPLTIPVSKPTLATLFKNAGYRSGIVGKWHLGLGEPKKGIDWNGKIAPGPNEIGFDESFIIPATVDRVPCVYVENGRVRGLDQADPIQVSYTDPLPGSKYPIGHQQPESKTLQDSDPQHSDTVINGLGESLFNLREDPAESRNLLESHPDLAAKMKERLAQLVKSR